MANEIGEIFLHTCIFILWDFLNIFKVIHKLTHRILLPYCIVQLSHSFSSYTSSLLAWAPFVFHRAGDLELGKMCQMEDCIEIGSSSWSVEAFLLSFCTLHSHIWCRSRQTCLNVQCAEKDSHFNLCHSHGKMCKVVILSFLKWQKTKGFWMCTIYQSYFLSFVLNYWLVITVNMKRGKNNPQWWWLFKALESFKIIQLNRNTSNNYWKILQNKMNIF